jgi:Fe-Mn family superoxide dismutase
MIKYSELPGAISAKALAEHVKLFYGYKDMLNRAEENIIIDPKPKKPALDHQFSNTMWSHSYSMGGVRLHEMFFGGLSLNPSPPSEQFMDTVVQEFGGLDELYTMIKSVALVSRGWAVLAQDPSTMYLHVFSMDSHDEGACFGFKPLLVIDVWEHAYWMDWGTNKAGYLDALKQYIDWKTVSDKFDYSLNLLIN